MNLAKLYPLFGRDKVLRASESGGVVRTVVSEPCNNCNRTHKISVAIRLRDAVAARTRVRVLDLPLSIPACAALPRGCSARRVADQLLSRPEVRGLAAFKPLHETIQEVMCGRPVYEEPRYSRWIKLAESMLFRKHGAKLSCYSSLRSFRMETSSTYALLWNELQHPTNTEEMKVLRKLLLLDQLVTPRWVVQRVHPNAYVDVWYRLPNGKSKWVLQRGRFKPTWKRIHFEVPGRTHQLRCPRCVDPAIGQNVMVDRTPRIEDRSKRIHVFCPNCENMWVVPLTGRSR